MTKLEIISLLLYVVPMLVMWSLCILCWFNEEISKVLNIKSIDDVCELVVISIMPAFNIVMYIAAITYIILYKLGTKNKPKHFK